MQISRLFINSLIFVFVFLCDNVLSVTLPPPHPPVKVLAAAASADKLRYYSFNEENYKKVGDKSSSSSSEPDWDNKNNNNAGFQSGDPFEVPSLSDIAQMMRDRDRRGSGSSAPADTGWGWPSTPKPTGWGWSETTTTAPPPPPPPPTTSGWGWHKIETTTWAPPPPTKGWGWSHHNDRGRSRHWSYESTDDNRVDTENNNKYWKYTENSGWGWGWWPTTTTTTTSTTTTPKYSPIYLSSDEAKYKPIKYPSTPISSAGGWSDSTKPSSSSSGGGGSSSRWNLPFRPSHHDYKLNPGWPHNHHDHDTQGSYWYSSPSPPWPENKSSGWGWTTRPPPPTTTTSGWGWKEEKSTTNGFEYKPGEDDLSRNIFPGDVYIKSGYPPGIPFPPPSSRSKEQNSFEDDTIPREHNHYRIVPYTPSPEERFRILSKRPPHEQEQGNRPNPFYTGKGPHHTHRTRPSHEDYTNDHSGGPYSNEGNKWFVNNFHRSRPGETTTTARSRTRPTTIKTSTTTTTDDPRKESSGGGGGGVNNIPDPTNSVTEGTTEKSSLKRPRFDEHGFKYIPVDHPIARRISNSPQDIYERLDLTGIGGGDRDFKRGGGGDSERRDDINQQSESRHHPRIQLWNADQPRQGRHIINHPEINLPQIQVSSRDLKVEPEGDFIPIFGPPPPPFYREALMERLKAEESTTTSTTTVSPPIPKTCPSGEGFSKILQKCEKPFIKLSKSTRMTTTKLTTTKSTRSTTSNSTTAPAKASTKISTAKSTATPTKEEVIKIVKSKT